MTLRDAVLKQLSAVRGEEWTLHRVLDADQRERTGTEAAPEIKELVARASAGRRSATRLLQGTGVACEPVEPGPTGTWEQTHADAHEAMTGLWDAVEAATEDQLAADPGLRRNHPQYVWRDVLISAVRGPILDYAGWHLRQDRTLEGLSVLSRWYEMIRGSGLPTKALSDASYDLACGFARVGRADDAMAYLPDAFVYNDRAAVPVLKAWAREDPDLSALTDRVDFRSLVGVTDATP